MAPSSPTSHLKPGGHGIERVRAQLLTSLHVGKLRPGDRVPSVRRLADLTGMNRKTVHRAYQALADEGLLDLRPGSGTFVSDGTPGSGGQPTPADLLRAANRCRAEASALGIGPDAFAAFLQNCFGTALRGVPVAVAECNREQVGLIAEELQAALGLHARPVILADLTSEAAHQLAGAAAVITTDCHRAEVAELAAPLGCPVYTVALDRVFPQRLVDHARTGSVLMIVRDRAFAPVFHRLLRQMAVPQETVERIRIVEPLDARAALSETGEDVAVYVSPLVDRGLVWRVPEGVRRLQLRWRLAPDALDRVRVQLALDLTVRRPAAPAAARASGH